MCVRILTVISHCVVERPTGNAAATPNARSSFLGSDPTDVPSLPTHVVTCKGSDSIPEVRLDYNDL